MCELLGMECNVPTDITFSFAGLASRGGKCGPHADGWGLALYEGKVARLFLEPTAAAASPLATFGREHPIKTTLADEDISVDFAAVTTPKDRVAVVATMPLTRDEAWTAGEPNTLWVFRRGRLAQTLEA